MIEYKDMKWYQALFYIPNRIFNLINKLIGLKGVALFGTYYLFYKKIIPAEAIGYTWILIILIVVFGEKALTVFKDIKK